MLDANKLLLLLLPVELLRGVAAFDPSGATTPFSLLLGAPAVEFSCGAELDDSFPSVGIGVLGLDGDEGGSFG